MKYLSIDYGKKRIGLAVGQVIPKGAGVIDGAAGVDKIVSEIEKVCLENEVEGIVIGLPRKASGDLGELAPEIDLFVQSLKKKLSLPVYFEEEDLTSVEAEDFFKEHKVEFDRKSGKVDELAAILILERYLSKDKSTNLGNE